MTNPAPESNKPHQFSRLEVYQAEHEFVDAIKRYFGEVWRIKSDGEYKGCTWDCRSPLIFDAGIWRLCTYARHHDARRAAPRLELIDSGHLLRFTILYDSLIPQMIIQ